MLTPGPNYKMSKAGKIYLAVTWNRALLNQRKRALIQAELADKVVIRSKRDRGGDN